MLKAILAVAAVVLLAPLLLACSFAPPGTGQLLPGKSDASPGKPGKLTVAVKGLKNLGRGGDTELAHVTPAEKRMLKKKGGSGTINPKTGLREFFGGEGGGGSMGRSDGRVGGGNRGDGRSASGFGSLKGAQARANKRGAQAQKEISKAFGADRDGRATVTIERRKSVINVAPGDERGGQSQRDGALILNITTEPSDGGELGGQAGEARKAQQKQRGRAATLLSGSEGIRDKLGRSGRRGVGKSLG